MSISPTSAAVWVIVSNSPNTGTSDHAWTAPDLMAAFQTSTNGGFWVSPKELRVFGSALRDDSRPDSDLDLLVTFTPEADWSLLDHVAMENELAELAGRPVDLVSQRAIERSSNWLRRQAILESAEPYFTCCVPTVLAGPS